MRKAIISNWAVIVEDTMYSPRKELGINLSFLEFQKTLEIHSIETLFRILKVSLYLFFHE